MDDRATGVTASFSGRPGGAAGGPDGSAAKPWLLHRPLPAAGTAGATRAAGPRPLRAAGALLSRVAALLGGVVALALAVLAVVHVAGLGLVVAEQDLRVEDHLVALGQAVPHLDHLLVVDAEGDLALVVAGRVG